MNNRENAQRREILELEEMKKKIVSEKKLLQSEIDENIATECDHEDKEDDAIKDEEEVESEREDEIDQNIATKCDHEDEEDEH